MSGRPSVLGPLLGVGTIVGALAVAQVMISAEIISPYIVPLPTEILASFWRVITEEGAPGRFLVTVGETLAAGCLIILVGMPIGLSLYRWPRLRLAFEPWLGAMAAAPLVLAYPLFLVLFGRSYLTVIMIGFASGVAPVALKTIEGFVSTRRVLINAGRSLRLTPTQEFRQILLPAALPQIFVGLRLGLIFCLINIVGVEFLINLGGLGQLVNELAEHYDLAGTYAAICFVVLVSILFFSILDRCEQWLQHRS
jgi:NitT/TauT family transport system permease protein